MCVGYKKCDIKTIDVWRAEQNKRQRVFAFSAKNWVLFCGDFFSLTDGTRLRPRADFQDCSACNFPLTICIYGQLNIGLF